jgi:hypothetical protein
VKTFFLFLRTAPCRVFIESAALPAWLRLLCLIPQRGPGRAIPREANYLDILSLGNTLVKGTVVEDGERKAKGAMDGDGGGGNLPINIFIIPFSSLLYSLILLFFVMDGFGSLCCRLSGTGVASLSVLPC